MSVTAFLLYTIIALGSVAIYMIRRRLNYWKERGIPHEEPTLLAGNFHGVRTTRTFADMFKETHLKFRGTGPFCGFYFFQRPAVLLLDPELVKNVLTKDFSNFADRGLYYNEKDDPLSATLFHLDDQKWRYLRNKLSPTFTSIKMKFMFPTVIKVVEEFVQVFDEMVDGGSKKINVINLLQRFTADVIASCAFGIECNSLKDPDAEFLKYGHRARVQPRHSPLVVGFMQGFPNLARKLHMRIIRDDVHNFFMGIVRDTVNYRIKNNVKRKDFLNILMDLSDGNLTAENKDMADMNGFTVEEMAAQSFIFFLAGFETTSSTMGFLLYQLAQNQKIQDRMREEIRNVFENHNNIFTYECMKKLTYMEQVISETLRMYPIASFLNRQAINDYKVPGHPDYVIGKGMPVFISVIGIHHDPEFYPNPDVFDPERFTPEKVLERDSCLWLPFGVGPRNCVGMRFGQMQMRVGLSHLLRDFKFSVCTDTEIPLQMDIKSVLINARNGIYLKVERA